MLLIGEGNVETGVDISSAFEVKLDGDTRYLDNLGQGLAWYPVKIHIVLELTALEATTGRTITVQVRQSGVTGSKDTYNRVLTQTYPIVAADDWILDSFELVIYNRYAAIFKNRIKVTVLSDNAGDSSISVVTRIYAEAMASPDVATGNPQVDVVEILSEAVTLSTDDQLNVNAAAVGDIAPIAIADINAECDTALTDYDPPTRAEATTDKAAIITEVDANETKIDAIPTASGQPSLGD